MKRGGVYQWLAAILACATLVNLFQQGFLDIDTYLREAFLELWKSPPFYIPLAQGGGVYLTDAVWVPGESKLALIALAPKFFKIKRIDFQYIGRGINRTFDFESLKSPMELRPLLTWNHKPIQNCTEIPTVTGDSHTDHNLFLVQCEVDSIQNSGELAVGGSLIGMFDARKGKLNAAPMMGFASRGSAARRRQDLQGISVFAQPVENFTPMINDIVAYYKKQGVRHVYFGIMQPFNSTETQAYLKALSAEIEAGFISIGWWESKDVDVEGMIPKTVIGDSLLYHAKSYDEMLVVVDLDEVPVSPEPTRRTFVEAIFDQTNMTDTCYATIHAHLLVKYGNATSHILAEKFPLRCNNTGFYDKAVLVVPNCDHVGVHIHGACHPGTKRKYMDIKNVSLHHYVNLWVNRYGSWKCQREVESELAIFHKEGIKTHKAQSSSAPTARSTVIPTIATTKNALLTDKDARIKTHTPRTEQANSPPMYIPLAQGGGVYLTDAVWVPGESKLALIALAPKFFKIKRIDFQYIGRGINRTFDFESLKSPMELRPLLTWNHKPIQNCTEIPTVTGDSHTDHNLFLVQCEVDSIQNSGELAVGGSLIGMFDARKGKLNAAPMMGFASRGSAARRRQDLQGISVFAQPVENFTPMINDIVAYYKKQGVRHVYFGIMQPFNSTETQAYLKALSAEIEAGFISIGWWESKDVDVEGMIPKTVIGDSLLYHAKSYDEMLVVVDLDEVPVSPEPTRRTFVEAIFDQTNMTDTCYATIHAHLLVKYGNATSHILAEKFPLRCNNTGFYDKAVLVVPNCDHVGVHIHGACHPGTKRKYMDIKNVSLHHYVNLWVNRYGSWKCQREVESELAIFHKEGIKTHKAQSSSAPTARSTVIPTIATTKNALLTDKDARIKTHTPRTEQANSPPMYIPLAQGGGVYLTDAVWVPGVSQLALMALAPKFFMTKSIDFQYIGRGINRTFDFESLKSPMELRPLLTWNHKPIQNCTEIPTVTGDSHTDHNLFLVQCEVDSIQNSGELAVGGSLIGMFDARKGKLNAAPMMGFASRGSAARRRQDLQGISVFAQPVENFTPMINDIVAYYKKQGVRHVYFGIMQPFNSTETQAYLKALSAEIEAGFISIGWWDSKDVDVEGMIPKTVIGDSLLYHAKSYDEMLVVVDLDEVPVSPEPTRRTFVEAIFDQTNMTDTCYATIHAHLLVTYGNATSHILAEKFPLRCNNTGFYDKAVLVVPNCDHVGVHIHGACHPGTKRKYMDVKNVFFHHYVNLWVDRYGGEKCQREVESELAIFHKEGIKTHKTK